MINKNLEKKALEIMAEELNIPVEQLSKQRAKTFAEFDIKELTEIELHFTLSDKLGYEIPKDKELQTLNNITKTLAYIQLNTPRTHYGHSP